ncbi:WD domain-containing protein [Colletotrichum asianum]|uniref:WD domain-containing protein n=1 Tax=Colletotrichum asianum TaxID=702518 RepID=A0A8H3VZS4_9PEZI|nr:WD domain-containing protein [Colletotrichum asianum]
MAPFSDHDDETERRFKRPRLADVTFCDRDLAEVHQTRLDESSKGSLLESLEPLEPGLSSEMQLMAVDGSDFATDSTKGMVADEWDIPSDFFEIATTGQSEIVCFGMICDLKGTCEQRGQEHLPGYFPVCLDSSSRFSSDKYQALRGQIQDECILDQQHGIAKKKRRGHLALACSLEISVYGPFELFDDIGGWFQDYEVYLQDPAICYLDTKYCNPQKISSDDILFCPMVSDVISSSFTLTPKELPEPSDFLDILSSHVELEEAPQPSAIRAVLKRHQKQALTFMLNREKDRELNSKYPNVWETVETDRGTMFMNTVSRVYQSREPPSFYGGIIADPMGLGKTLTMISLVATDMDSEKELSIHNENDPAEKQDVSATLVIIPPPILGTWEQQLYDHTLAGSLICRRHHGKTRLAGTEELETVNMVLTTYHTVAAEWKANNSGRKSTIFSVRWRRIILDEGHYIRNGNSRMARAVCALEAISRWAVTGTPIQNRLGDLASLLRFVRVYPYADSKQFDTDISRLWKSGEDEEAVSRLKRLSACLLLRRPKSTINLPPRRDLVHTVEFTPQERLVYEGIRQQTIAQINEALGDNTGTHKSRCYVNVLQQIESLRLFCNLGLYYESRHDRGASKRVEADEWSKTAQTTFNSQRGMSSITCLHCTSALGLTETLLDDANSGTGTAQYSSCLKFTCNECVDKIVHSGGALSCGHTPPCQTAPVSTSGSALEETGSFTAPQLGVSAIDPPSKIKALIHDIRKVSSVEKCVVFSSWRLTLDLIKAGLDQECIQSIRFDGKIPQKDRQSVVERFETDPNVRVMLLTLSCGAVGLTLTAASRAYLVEPHWNPTLEEQALARIHRLGQSREVTTVRLCVRNSFEEAS